MSAPHAAPTIAGADAGIDDRPEPADRSIRSGLRRRGPAVAVAIGALLTAIYLAIAAIAGARLDRANQLGVEGRPAAALAEARTVDVGPAKSRAALVEAYALVQLGDDVGADASYSRAAAADPNNWAIHANWASTLVRIGRPARAREEFEHARALNPRMDLPPGFRVSANATRGPNSPHGAGHDVK
jgi:Flp pilus assembly protein TadD